MSSFVRNKTLVKALPGAQDKWVGRSRVTDLIWYELFKPETRKTLSATSNEGEGRERKSSSRLLLPRPELTSSSDQALRMPPNLGLRCYLLPQYISYADLNSPTEPKPRAKQKVSSFVFDLELVRLTGRSY